VETMDAKQFAVRLNDIISECDEAAFRRVETFEEVGLLTRDNGIVVTMRDGSQFQITIVESRQARD